MLGELGLIEALLAEGVATRELVYFNRFGQRMWGEPRGRFAGHATPQISLHRGALQGVLLDAATQRLGPDPPPGPDGLQRINWAADLAFARSLRPPSSRPIAATVRSSACRSPMSAPDGFDRIEDVFAPGELEAIAAQYRVLTGLKSTSEPLVR
ncbi:hypothetical protein [Sorangium sp. So ce131]|uniref:hypothetical protein n=1 Tax=Sorangium sp. So ce131 TaxID=3133282 RepID=UPI003F626BF6